MRSIFPLIVAVSLMAFTLPAHAQTFADELASYEATPDTGRTIYFAAQAVTTVQDRDVFEAAVRANGPLDTEDVRAIAWAYYNAGDFAEAKQFVDGTDVGWNQNTAVYPILLEVRKQGYTAETAQLAAGLDPHVNWVVFGGLTPDADQAWINMYLTSAQDINAGIALSAFKFKRHNPMLKLVNADRVTKAQASDFYEALYMALWLGYLNAEDQTAAQAVAMEKAATTMKSIRDMLSE